MIHISLDMTAAEARTIAAWHMEQSREEGDRHDRIAFTLFRLAHAMRRK